MNAKKVSARPSERKRTSSWRRAKVFWSGRSQAIRLPKEMRVDAAEVAIGREGNRLVIEPLVIERDAKGWPKAWWKLAGAAPEFDVGTRETRHERGEVLSKKR